MGAAPPSLAIQVIIGLRPQTSLASAYSAMRPRLERLPSRPWLGRVLAMASFVASLVVAQNRQARH